MARNYFPRCENCINQNKSIEKISIFNLLLKVLNSLNGSSVDENLCQPFGRFFK
jgi:hypothetical protein